MLHQTHTQRKWASLSKDEQVQVRPYTINPNNQYVSKIVFKADFHVKNNTTPEPYDTDLMAKEFTMQFAQHAFTKGQNVCNDYHTTDIKQFRISKITYLFLLILSFVLDRI